MSKREEGDSYLPRAVIEIYRELVARVVELEGSELTTHRRNQGPALMKRKVAVYLLFSVSGIGMLSRDAAIIMKKSEPWVTASKQDIERRMKASKMFRADIERMMAEFRKLEKAVENKISGVPEA
jgi:hypothetical protein